MNPSVILCECLYEIQIRCFVSSLLLFILLFFLGFASSFPFLLSFFLKIMMARSSSSILNIAGWWAFLSFYLPSTYHLTERSQQFLFEISVLILIDPFAVFNTVDFCLFHFPDTAFLPFFLLSFLPLFQSPLLV